MKIRILFIALLISGLSWGQATLPVSRTGWTGAEPTGWSQTNTTDRTTSSACTGNDACIFDATNDVIMVNFTGTPGTLTFKLKKQSLTGTVSKMTVEESPDGSTWSTIGNYGAASPQTVITDCGDITVTLLSTSRYVRWTYTKGTGNCDLDDVNITVGCTPPADPVGAISGTTPACNSTSLSFSGTVSLPLYYYWQTSATGQSTLNNAASSLTANTVGTTNYYVRAYDSSTTCWSTNATAAYPVTIYANPAVTSSPSSVSITETSGTSFTVAHTNTATYQWQVDYDGDGTFDATVTNTGVYSGATTATLTLTNAPITMNGYKYKCIIWGQSPCSGFDQSAAATLTVTSLYSSASDIVAISSSEPTTISSTVNNTTIATSSNGVQVWQIRVRDGGGTADADTAATILTAFNIAQAAGNSVTTWSDAIYSVGLFDGTTFVANGTVTANQIQFTGLNVNVPDGTNKDLYLRLSLKCPLGAGAKDGDDFGFSISNANTTFSNTGSGKSSFAAATSANSYNVIDVTATKLAVTTQPVTTGQNYTMSSVVVKATDACGNVDLGFTGTVSLSSTGTMTGAPLTVAAVAGVATFSTIVHTVVATGLTLTASYAGLTPVTSTTFDITAITVLQPGDIAILAFNTALASGDDEISFITFVDITVGTRIDITDNAFQKCGTTNGWGISEGWIRLERTGGTLTKGTIVTVNVTTAGVASVVSPDPSSWTCSKPQPTSQGTFNMNNTGEQIFFLSGGTVGGTNASTATSDGGTYSGTILYGFNTKGNIWTPICGNSAAGGTQNSDKPKNFDCFLTWPTSQSDLNKYTGPTTAATQRDWVARISNSANWTGYADNTAYSAGPNFYGASYTILSGGYSSGVWIGDTNTNWFECSNWQSRKVPDTTVNVVVGASAMQGVVVDATATNASSFSYLAQCKDITVSNYNVKIEGSSSNVLEVYGNVVISATGSIDMDDSSSATADGVIKLYGNWTNSVGSAALAEGNGTVQFVGTSSQFISSVANEGTEVFYNVVLDNNFDTAVSNDLIASGDLTIKTGRTVSIDSNGFIKAYKKLDHSGNLTIEDNGQFIQVDETDANVGTYNSTTFKVKRIADVNQYDYVYWSSPTNSFDQTNILSNGMRLIWNTTYANADTQGNWNWASTEAGYPAMTKGKGYAICVPNSSPVRPAAATSQLTTFTGKPNNGQFTFPITKGTITADFTNAAGVPTTKYDDNWNLVGNPYPSAIDAEKFLSVNNDIEGTVWIWKHGQKPDATQSPFYANFTYNYYSSDYCKYNKLGASDTNFPGKIASGQGFMVCMLESFVGSSSTITFNNSMRSDAASITNPYAPYSNGDFYRTANNNTDSLGAVEEKSRVWLDIFNNASNQTDTTLLGYSTYSTFGRDRFYDAIFVPRNTVSLYSLINNETFIIQGRPLPLDINDKVPMGINIMDAGSHTIAIKKADGVFIDQVPVYLEDKLLNIIHDLKQAPYVFNSAKGIFNDRFVLRYTNESLGNNDFDSLDHNVVVSAHNGEMTVNSYIENLAEVTVYDILGRQLLDVKNIARRMFVTSTISTSQQALLGKIKLDN